MSACKKKKGPSTNFIKNDTKKLAKYLAIAKCYKNGSPKVLGTCYKRIVEIYTDMANLDEALEYGKQHLGLVLDQGNYAEEPHVLNSLGRIYLLKGQCSTDCKEANKLFKTAEHTLKNGVVQGLQERTDEALENLRRAIMICNSNNLLDVLQQCYLNEAQILLKKGDYNTALSCSDKALEVANKLKDKVRKCDSLCLKAKIFCKLSQYKYAKRIFLKAYKLNILIGNDKLEVESSLKAAAVMCYTQDLLTYYDGLDSPNNIAFKTLYETLGDGACYFKNYADAVDYYLKMLRYAQLAEDSEKSLIPIYISLYQTYKDMGSYDSALSFFKKEYDLIKDVPKEAYTTSLNYAETMSLAKRPYHDIEKLCLEARCNAQKMNDKNRELKALKHLLKYQRNYGEIVKINQTKYELKLLGCDIGFDNVEDDQISVGEDEHTRAAWDDVCLEDLTDPSEASDAEVDNSLEKSEVKRYTARRNLKGETQLHTATIKGELRRVKTLLDKGHPVDVRDYAGWTALHEAACYGHTDIAEILIEHQANVTDDGGSNCSNGTTPLHSAATNGHFKLILLLLKKGANPSLKTKTGETPRDLLQEWRSCKQLGENDETLYNIVLDKLCPALQ